MFSSWFTVGVQILLLNTNNNNNNNNKVKAEVHPTTCYDGTDDLQALYRRGWLTSRSGPLYPRERPGTHCTGGWVGPRTGLNGCIKNLVPTGIYFPVPFFPSIHFVLSNRSVLLMSLMFHTTALIQQTQHKHPCDRLDSNSHSQQANGRRPTPYTAQPLRSAGIRSPDRPARSESLYRLSNTGTRWHGAVNLLHPPGIAPWFLGRPAPSTTLTELPRLIWPHTKHVIEFHFEDEWSNWF
jgi:hypothetical protein